MEPTQRNEELSLETPEQAEARLSGVSVQEKPYTDLAQDEKTVRDADLAAKFEKGQGSTGAVDPTPHEVIPPYANQLSGDPMSHEENREAFEQDRRDIEAAKSRISKQLELLEKQGGDATKYKIPTEPFSGTMRKDLKELALAIEADREANESAFYHSLLSSGEVASLLAGYNEAKSAKAKTPGVDALQVSNENQGFFGRMMNALSGNTRKLDSQNAAFELVDEKWKALEDLINNQVAAKGMNLFITTDNEIVQSSPRNKAGILELFKKYTNLNVE